MKDLFFSLPEAVVVGNGEFPSHEIPLQVLDSSSLVICCDGGANSYIESGRTPQFIIGDGDSLSTDNRTRFADRFLHNSDQETNDQTKAVRYLHSKGIRRIAIVAATGKREDHTLGNISLLQEYLHMGMEVTMLTDYGFFVAVRGTQTFKSFAGQQVSVFGLQTQGMRSQGLKYSLYDFTAWWQGTLNEAEGKEFTIFTEGEYLVYRTYQKKDSNLL